MTTQILIESLQSLDDSVKEFINHIQKSRVIAFYGQMGAGKTTFIKSLCEQLGAEDIATSPSFAIVNEYTMKHGPKLIYHFDFYRIKDIIEVYDIGFEDYIASGNYCFIEWPEKIESLLPIDTMRVIISEQNGGTRLLTFDLD